MIEASLDVAGCNGEVSWRFRGMASALPCGRLTRTFPVDLAGLSGGPSGVARRLDDMRPPGARALAQNVFSEMGA